MKYVFGLAAVLLPALGLQSALFDWNNVVLEIMPTDFTNGQGDWSQTFNNVDNTGVNVTVTIGTVGAAAFNTAPRLGVGDISTGDLGIGDVLQLDMATMGEGQLSSRLDISVTFSKAVTGVNFQIFDVDRGTADNDGAFSFVDTVGDFQMFLAEGGIAQPEDSPFFSVFGEGPFDFVPPPGISFDAWPDDELAGPTVISSFEENETLYYTGDGDEVVNNPATLDGQRGILYVDFGNTSVTGFSFTYSSLPGPGTTLQDILTDQAIAMGHIGFEFTPIPEFGTVAGFGVFLVGIAAWDWRRRRLRLAAESESRES